MSHFRSSTLLTGVSPALLFMVMTASAGHLDELLAGVTSFPHHPTPGPVFVFGPDAFPVLTGDAGGGYGRKRILY